MINWVPIALIALVIVAVGTLICVPVIVGWREPRLDRRRILADGTTARALVAKIEPRPGTGLRTVHFEFPPTERAHGIAGTQATTSAALAIVGLSEGSSVQVHYLPQWPRWAFIDALTRAERGVAWRHSVMDSASLETAPALFYVSFMHAAIAGALTASKGNFGLAGGGDVVIDHDGIKMTGKRRPPFLFPRPARRDISLNDVVNVERFRDMVLFDVLEPEEKAQKVQFRAVNEHEAEAIAQRLPSAKTSAFAPILTEHAAFATALVKVTPNAPVTPALILANLLMFAVATALGGGLIKVHPEVMIRLGTDYTPLTLGGQWWRLLTSTFLHFGLLHIAFNMWALYVNGMAAERIFGSVRFLVIYLVAGICGSLASLFWHPLVNGAGASGAIFGVLGALIAFFVRKESGVPPSVLKSQLNTAAIFAIYSLINGAQFKSIDNAAHLGGLVAGFIMGFILSRPIHADRDLAPWTRQWLAAVAVIGLTTAGVVYIVNKTRATVRSLGGIKLGMSTDELLKAKGQPVRRADHYWVYNSVDARHNGALTAGFSGGGSSEGAVIAVQYTGDQASAPADLPFLDGMSKNAVVKNYAPMTSWRTNDDGSVVIWFRSGVFVALREAVVFEYGIYDTTTLGGRAQ